MGGRWAAGGRLAAAWRPVIGAWAGPVTGVGLSTGGADPSRWELTGRKVEGNEQCRPSQDVSPARAILIE